MENKVLENRMRRTLARRGYRLEKSRQRDRRATTYGRYLVFEIRTNTVYDRIPADRRGSDCTVTLDEIVRWADSTPASNEESSS
jgi:hypothetical protein